MQIDEVLFRAISVWSVLISIFTIAFVFFWKGKDEG